MIESTMEKNKKGIIIQLSYFFYEKRSSCSCGRRLLAVTRRRLYFRVVPSFPWHRYDEDKVPWLFLGHSDDEWLCWVP